MTKPQVSSISSGRSTVLPSLVQSCCCGSAAYCLRADRNQEAAPSVALSICLDDSVIPSALILQVLVDLHFLVDFRPLTEWYGLDCYPTATNTLLLRSLQKVVLFDSIMIKFAVFHFQDFTTLFNLWTLCSWQYHHISPWKMHSRRKKKDKNEIPQDGRSRPVNYLKVIHPGVIKGGWYPIRGGWLIASRQPMDNLSCGIICV